MNSKQQMVSVFAICLSFIIAAAIFTYKPEMTEQDTLKFPVGIPPSLGYATSVTLGEEQINAIVVSGQGSSSEQANKATLRVGVDSDDEDASTAIESNAAAMNAVIDAIKAQGIGEDAISTINYNVRHIYDWEIKRVIGYMVNNMVKVEIEDLALVGNVIDAAAGAGANNIQGISFELTDERAQELQNNAYVLALQDARGKADLIAETLGLEITGVQYVSESSYYPYTTRMTYAEADYGESAAPTPIIEGTLSVSVNVQVAFTFE